LSKKTKPLFFKVIFSASFDNAMRANALWQPFFNEDLIAQSDLIVSDAVKPKTTKSPGMPTSVLVAIPSTSSH